MAGTKKNPDSLMFKVEEGSEGNNTVNKGATDAKAFQRESYGWQ